MEHKFFMHRIKEENGTYVKGIEVHDDKNSAIRSFYAYMTYAYNNPKFPDVTYVSCKITDIDGNILQPYDRKWYKTDPTDNTFFMHHIRKDGETFSKDIDICQSFDAAKLAFSDAMAYGYYNPKFASVELVSCMITDRFGVVMKPYDETWRIPDPDPEDEPEQTQQAGE